MSQVVRFLASVLLVASGWTLAKALAGSDTFPSVMETTSALLEILVSFNFYLKLTETLVFAFMGLLGGIFFAYIAAISIRVNAFWRQSLIPTVNSIRAVPTIILLPIILVLLGPTYEALIVATAVAVFSQLVLIVLAGLDSADNGWSELAKILQLGRLQRLVLIEIPNSARNLLNGLQLFSSRAYGTVILCGMIIGTPGLGRSLSASREDAQFDEVFAYAGILALLGVMIFQILVSFEQRIMRAWGLVER